MVENVFILHLIKQESGGFLYKVGKFSVERAIYPYWILTILLGWLYLLWIYRMKQTGHLHYFPEQWGFDMSSGGKDGGDSRLAFAMDTVSEGALIPKEVSTGTCEHYWHTLKYSAVLWGQTLTTLTSPTFCVITYVAQMWPRCQPAGCLHVPQVTGVSLFFKI